MQLTASEKATLQFYQWEYLGRGYHRTGEQVAIEPPFHPFVHKSFTDDNYQDDSRSPNFLKRLADVFISQPKPEPKKQTELKIVTQPSPFVGKRIGFSISFPKEQKTSLKVDVEFLNMLAFSYSELAFEFYANQSTIDIQVICSIEDSHRVKSYLKAYFPTIIIHRFNPTNLSFKEQSPVAIVDFGLNSEFMLPLQYSDSFHNDSLTAIIALLDGVQQNETVLIQIIFQGVTAPWSKHIMNAVSDNNGDCFFAEEPEFLEQSKEKISEQLFSTIFRIAVQGNTAYRTQYLTSELINSISKISASPYNQLVPLSNKGYDYHQHLQNVYERKSNRLGMLLNVKELALFVHYPNESVVSKKLGIQTVKTKSLPEIATYQKYTLGMNSHQGVANSITLNDEARLRHMHIIGATGVGKSTLIGQMLLEDIKLGNGCVLFDPHGDIVEDILLRIPTHRQKDIIVIDPSDTEFPIGFNILSAKTEVEKIVLSSDIVATFKRYATSWGDTMTAVLSNAVNTFLESDRKATLIELKRFLIEASFRKQFLETVEDNAIHYYWKNEFPIVKKSISPLLTRIDTFLRPKIIRYMLAQNDGVDFKKCIEEKKVVLIKLPQGLIGEENSYLLGSLFLAKLNQAAQGRQALEKKLRHPYYVYLDEFQNFITPSITSMLSGARKYGLGLVLAHQELAQIENTKVLNSVISNSHIRLCFRLGDIDAKRLENGFSFFNYEDLQSLGIGQAILRIGSSKNDCNITTFQLTEVLKGGASQRNSIIANTRKEYATPKEEITKVLQQLLPKVEKDPKNIIDSAPKHIPFKNPKLKSTNNTTNNSLAYDEISKKNVFEKNKKEFLEQENKKIQQRKHISLQHFVKNVAEQRNFKVTLEKQTNNGGRVDVSLEKKQLRIAIEISVTNTLEYEVKNIKKCIDSKYNHVFMISENIVHLRNIKNRASEMINSKAISIVEFLNPLELAKRLDEFNITETPTVRAVMIKGYRVKTNYSKEPIEENSRKNLNKIILEQLKTRG